MPVFLDASAAEFEERFTAVLGAKREEAADVDAAAAGILAEVRAEGDAALSRLTARFDGEAAARKGVSFSADEIAEGVDATPPDVAAAIELAAERIEAFHRRQLPEDARWRDAAGLEIGWRWRAVDAAGLYAPGGAASYPSSVLMNALPAQVAGVERLAMCVPAPGGQINPAVLYAAHRAGVAEIHRIGGAQAIAALAYGTESVAKVDVIVGPGNAYVAAAKRQVFGRVGLDSIAGPSEVVIVAEAGVVDPDWLALDLMAQAEHDASAQSILITPDAVFGREVAAAVTARLTMLERREIAGASWREFGAVIAVRDLAEAAALVDRLAPEHLQLCIADPDALASRIRHAGAIFLGALTPEAIGDYVAGPNHVLPTARSARFASGLSVLDFMKRTTLARCAEGGLAAVGGAAARLARAEGLEAHALSIEARLAHLEEER